MHPHPEPRAVCAFHPLSLEQNALLSSSSSSLLHPLLFFIFVCVYSSLCAAHSCCESLFAYLAFCASLSRLSESLKMKNVPCLEFYFSSRLIYFIYLFFVKCVLRGFFAEKKILHFLEVIFGRNCWWVLMGSLSFSEDWSKKY